MSQPYDRLAMNELWKKYPNKASCLLIVLKYFVVLGYKRKFLKLFTKKIMYLEVFEANKVIIGIESSVLR